MRFVWSRFAEADIATVRRFIEKGNGDLVPVASEFSFTEKYYSSLLAILKSLVSLTPFLLFFSLSDWCYD